MKIVVIGAGPSGLICSYKLALYGHEVVLIEKNNKVGKKIYITGKGRCNVTNNCSQEDFINNIVTNPKFLFSAFNNFNSQDTMSLFEDNGINLVTERGNRVFPISYNAADIAETLMRLNKNSGVDIHLNENVTQMFKSNDSFTIKTNKNIYNADKVVIATGGLSYSYTGSTGDGYKFAKSFGHTIINPVPGLVTLKIKESVPSNLYKFTLKNVALTAKYGSTKIHEFGEITFYKEGVAGPIALTISSLINKVETEKVSIEIDLKPALSNETLDQRILRETQNPLNKTVEDLIHKLLPSQFVPWFIGLSHIDKERTLLNFTKEDRLQILTSLKRFKLTYIGLDDIERAIITSGGISTKEINPKTMESKIVSGLYFAGEIIDVDAFTGGYNMQIAFSTGALVADSIGY